MEKYYWYKECPNCHQGRLILTEDITNKRIYLHCEECERGWLNPNEIDDRTKSFLTINMDYETENPDIKKIESYGWKDIAKNSFTE